MLGRIVERECAIKMHSPACDGPCMQQGQAHEAMPDHERPLRPLLICDGQELDSKLTHHVGVERYNVRGPRAVKNREQQQRIFGRLPERFGLLDQQTCPLDSSPGFRRRVAADMEEWGYECNLQLDLFATPGGRPRQGGDQVARELELTWSCEGWGGVRRELGGLPPERRGFPDLAGLGPMSRQQLRSALRRFREFALDGFGDAGMQRASRLAQQRPVSRVLHEGMLEQ